MTRQEHLLTIVGEECNEIAQRCSKALRFGMEEKQKDQPFTNKERILEEFNDLLAVMEMLMDEPLQNFVFPGMMGTKKLKVEKYLEYSKSLGI